MKLQKATLFGLYAVLELAADPERQLTVTEIAAKYGISAHHLAKVLRDLGRAGMIDAVRGVGGGYRFVGDTHKLTLMDVIRVFEDVDTDIDESLPGRDTAEGLRFVLAEMNSHTVPTLKSISLATMLKLIARRPWAKPA